MPDDETGDEDDPFRTLIPGDVTKVEFKVSNDAERDETPDGPAWKTYSDDRSATVRVDGEEFDPDDMSIEELREKFDDARHEARETMYTGATFSYEVEGTVEMPTDMTVKMGEDGDEFTVNDVEILSGEQARKRAKQIREDAPDEEYLTDSTTCDIDEVIDALERAKERGVDTVQVNDDGQTRHSRPRIRNNHASFHHMRPLPGDLREWVEL